MADGESRFSLRARDEAHRLQHDYIGTEHILLAILRDGANAGASLLRSLGIDLARLRARLEELVAPGVMQVAADQLPFTHRAKNVLEYAQEEMSDLGKKALGAEHVVLGLLREGGGVTAQAFRELGITLEKARAKLAKPEQAPEPALPDRLTERAQALLASAQDEARRLGHDAVGTEELLLALARLTSGVAACVLKGLGVRPGAIRAEVERQVSPGAGVPPGTTLPYTKRARQALELAVEEAARLHQERLGTEHLLLGLLREPKGLASHVLGRLGVTLDAARAAIPAPE